MSGYVQGRMDTEVRIRGVVRKVRFHNPENGFMILLVEDERDEAKNHQVLGYFEGLSGGTTCEFYGGWKRHEQWGEQLWATGYAPVPPATEEGIRKYLGSGLVPGIGPGTADRLVDAFGAETVAVLDEHPERLTEVPGIGPKKAGSIRAMWAGQRVVHEVMSFLRGHSIGAADAIKVYKEFGDQTTLVVRTQPYRLTSIRGISFLKADALAQALGFGHDHPERLQAGLEHVLAYEAEGKDGHTYLPREQLVSAAAQLLGAEPSSVAAALDALLSSRRFVGDARLDRGEAVYRTSTYRSERAVASHLARLGSAGSSRLGKLDERTLERLFRTLATREGLSLSPDQQRGVLGALRHPLSVLAGGPGTGKTYSMRALIHALGHARASVLLAAPTGRATRRLSAATGVPATTLHRLLGIRPGVHEPELDEANPLEAHMIIVDEASMLDVRLMEQLLAAVPEGTHVLLVGDPDQLPSVGAGNVLADIIDSGAVPTVKLDRIYRQEEASTITHNAHRINRGEMPVWRDRAHPAINDFFFFPSKATLEGTEEENAAEMVVELVSERLPRWLRCDPSQIQVLTAMRGNACGVRNLNSLLQEKLNPSSPQKPQKQWGHTVFRPGDKVMQMVNNYDKGVFNGDVGTVSRVEERESIVAVRLEDGREVEYEGSELDELSLSYCITTHKSQGSEYPVCVIPIVKSQYMLLERRLIYTAVTRARSVVVLVGSQQALWQAVNNKGGRKPTPDGRVRYTGLAPLLRLAYDAEQKQSVGGTR